jgi:Asp-tRNA(Asn)/Glu-tRNA(Gln) amidotransferase A subunit family amidase
MLMSLVSTVSAQDADPFQVYETTIAEIREALHSGRTDCRAIIAQSLRRIDAFDKDGPRINALVRVNPEALRAADSLDLRFESSGMIGPLHCVPMVVKENMETVELPTTAGSLSLQDFMTNRDATMVRQIKEAGAIIVAKANMAEFAFSPYETVSSILPGYTRNPYVLDRVTAGSSGGTAAAIAASYGTVGLGTDTGNSIRGPSAHQALVGIRSTMGLTSRSGIVPLSLAADIAGPMARTVSDAAAVFQVVVGADPNDPVTAGASEHLPVDYMAALRVDALRGSRLGVLTQAYMRSTTDSEVVTRFQEAIEDLRELGATVIPDLSVDSLNVWRRALSGSCSQFKFDLESWLAEHGDSPPKKTLDEIIRSRQYHPSIESRLRANAEANIPPEENPGCRSRDEFRARLRGGVLELMLRYDLDALIYPTWSNPPRLIGDLNTPHGDNNQLFSPSTGFPAVTVPMGYLRDGSLPAGLQFFGRPWGEATLIGLAYAYEQGTRHRRPPVTTPPLP